MSEGRQTDIVDLAARVTKIEEAIKKPQKDWWDRLAAVSGIVASLLAAGIGFYATNVYNARSKEREAADRARNVASGELQTLEKYLPHMGSKDETMKQAAYEAVSVMENPAVAKVTAVFKSADMRAKSATGEATGSAALVDLKAIVGLWQYPERAVWIRVKTDGSTFQCRVSKQGAIVARGSFATPNTIKWDNVWGVETIEYQPERLTIHAPSRMTFTVVPAPGPMADDCAENLSSRGR